jgi:hypothetical protein
MTPAFAITIEVVVDDKDLRHTLAWRCAHKA